MLCPQCRAENGPARRFCAACGASFALRCAACGFENEPLAKFCGGCGQFLPPAGGGAGREGRWAQPGPPPPPPPKNLPGRDAPQGESKQGAALFADPQGSMEVLAGRDPGEAPPLLGP